MVKGIRISWEGGIEEIKDFDSVKLAVNLGFSANNGVISYWQNGNIVFDEIQ